MNERPYELPWMFLKRKVRPLALAFTILMLAVASDMLIAQSDYANGFEHDKIPGVLVGGLALTSALSFLAGWWFKKEGFMQTGLVLASAVFSVALINTIEEKGFGRMTVWINGAMLIASIGSYAIERMISVRQERREKILAAFPSLTVE